MEFQKGSRRALWGASLALVGALSSGANINVARAQSVTSSSPISIALSAFKVVHDKDGHESLVAASKARPGDIIEYRATTTNSSTRTLANVQTAIPIPSGLVFVSSSQRPASATASADGRTFGSMPLKRVVRDATGAAKVVMVPLSQYRSVRWTIGQLAAGQSVQVSVRARLRASAEKEVAP